MRFTLVTIGFGVRFSLLIIASASLFSPRLAFAKATRADGLACLAWLSKLEATGANQKTFDAKRYVYGLSGWAAMHSDLPNTTYEERLKLANNSKPNVEACAKTETEVPKLKLLEKLFLAAPKENVPEKFLTCTKALVILDRVAVKTNDKKITDETQEWGKKLGSIMGAFDEKIDIKKRFADILAAPPGSKETSDYLKTIEFKALKSNCEMFSY
jgi:hypothetical protein